MHPIPRAIILAAILFAAAGCAQVRHDEFIAAGQRFHTGTRIVLWSDPGGYDGYRGGGHFNRRTTSGISSLDELRRVVDQFVIHYDTCGSSRECFNVLNARNLSVHFMLDTDGTIYQTLDLKERAWHATTSNSRSIGIEIANLGAYPQSELSTLLRWRSLRSIRTNLVVGQVQGQTLYQYDFTPQQYDALIKLSAALCRTFPNIRCDWPHTYQKLPDDQLANFHGVLGHYHIQSNKQDPGPAFQWDRVIDGARSILLRWH